MLNALKRWMSRAPTGPDWTGVSAWAQAQGHTFKRARDDAGFVIDGSIAGRPWRLEWGPSQRAYIAPRELRMRMELGLPGGLQMLVLSRPLMESLERETFERYTMSNQTQIDVATPEEMRWLAMFPKVTVPGPREWRSRYAVVSSEPHAAIGWLEGELAQRLDRAGANLLAGQPPFVLMTLRGRVYLRLQAEQPDPRVIAETVSLFDAAARAAVQVGGSEVEGAPDWPATSSTAWQTQLQVEEPEPPPIPPRR